MIRARTTTTAAAALVLPVLLLASACSGGSGGSGGEDPRPVPTGPVPVTLPLPVDAAAERVCPPLVSALPATVADGLARRAVSGDAQRTAAWGTDPVITLACGTGPSGQPGIDGALFGIGLPDSDCAIAEPDPTRCLEMLQRDDGDASLLTTYNRAVTITVRVPDAFDVTAVQDMLPVLLRLPVSVGASPTPSASPSVSATPSGG